VQNTSFATILLIGFGVTIVELLLVVYIWPLKIDVDEERKLPFYYFLTRQYWTTPEQLPLVQVVRPENESFLNNHYNIQNDYSFRESLLAL
jgi:hypothetical protein